MNVGCDFVFFNFCVSNNVLFDMIYVYNEISVFLLVKRVIIKKCVLKRKGKELISFLNIGILLKI